MSMEHAIIRLHVGEENYANSERVNCPIFVVETKESLSEQFYPGTICSLHYFHMKMFNTNGLYLF